MTGRAKSTLLPTAAPILRPVAAVASGSLRLLPVASEPYDRGVGQRTMVGAPGGPAVALV